MTLLKKLAFVLSALFITQCATTPPSTSTSGGGPTSRVSTEKTEASETATLSNGCPLDKMQWIYSSKQYDSLKQKELAEKITLAAETDAATMDRLVATKNNNPLTITSSLKEYVESMAKSRTPVSDEFYKQYVNSRMTMCAVIDALRNGSIKEEESSKVAGNTFRDIARSFEKLKK